MRRQLFAASMLLFGVASPTLAQGLNQAVDDLKIQVHGFATQGFIYTTHNNWNTTSSSDGSPAWTEAVVNLSAQPEPRLRVGVQARFFLLGDYGDTITLDWAQADYKVNGYFGIRAGKVKTMAGLFTDSQDIDPAQLWVLLPQSVYAVGSRNSTLAHYGGLLYGTIPLGERLGKLEYRAYGGRRIVDNQDQDLAPLEDRGLSFPAGISGPTYGGTLLWHTPLDGLMLGSSEGAEKLSGPLTLSGIPGLPPVPGTLATMPFNAVSFYGLYDRHRFMAASEYVRIAPHGIVSFAIPQIPSMPVANDRRSSYLMASYRLTGRLAAGAYYSYATDRQMPLSTARFQKDWNLTIRFDFSPFLYLKLEQHFLDGTLIGFSQANNSHLSPRTRMTLLKLGVAF